MSKKAAKFQPIDHVAERNARNLSQTAYWKPLGVTQSSGSRYEAGSQKIPAAVQKLAYMAYRQNIAIPEVQ